jgi:hypothetical protein
MIFEEQTFETEKKEHQMPVVIKQSFIRIEVDLPWKRFSIVVFPPLPLLSLAPARRIEEYCTYIIIARPIPDKSHPRNTLPIMRRLTSYAKKMRRLLKELTQQKCKNIA